jgi:hypothetical protein
MVLAIVIAVMGCVPNGEKTVLGRTAPSQPLVVAADDSANATVDYRAMEAKIRPSESDGQVFEYY